MKKNIGTIDRVIRIVLGLGILGAGYAFRSWFGLIGIIPLATAAIGNCPAYLPFGIKTCKTDSTSKADNG